MKKILVVLLAICFSVAFTNSASALTQRFQEDGMYGTHHNFDKIELFITEGSANWNNPGINNFSVADWIGSTLNPGYAKAEGPDVGYAQFDLQINNSGPFGFDFLTWENGQLLGTTHIDWNGSWSYCATEPDNDYNREPVPEPASMVLLGTGLAAFIIRRKKMKS